MRLYSSFFDKCVEQQTKEENRENAVNIKGEVGQFKPW